MISIKEKIQSKPSVALQFMVDGLKRQSLRNDFTVEMGSFGDHIKDFKCFGCAATCTIQEIAQKDFVDFNVIETTRRANFLGFDVYELSWFEGAMDFARRGKLSGIFNFCGQQYEQPQEYPFFLTNDNWKEQIPVVQETIAQLKQQGL
jgi:hypothetical protein